MNNHTTKQIPRIESSKGTIRSIAGSMLLKKYRIALLLFVVSLIVAFPYKKAQNIERYPRVDEPSHQTVIAPFNVRVLKSDSLYQAELSNAEVFVSPVFRRDSSSLDSVVPILDSIVLELTVLKSLGNSPLVIENTHSADPDSVEVDTNAVEIDTVFVATQDSIRTATMQSLKRFFTNEDIYSMVSHINWVQSIRDSIVNALETGLMSHIPVKNIQELQKYQEQYDAPFYRVFTSSETITIHSDSGEENLKISTLESIPVLYLSLFADITLPSTQRAGLASALYQIFSKIIEPTLRFDPSETERQISLKRAEVSRVIRTIPRDVEIVRKNQQVTTTIAANLAAIERQYKEQTSPVIEMKTIVSQGTTLLMLLILSFILVRNLKDMVPRGIDVVTYYNVISLIVAVSFLIIRIGAIIMESVIPSGTLLDSALVYTAVPVVVGALLAAALFNKETGFVIAIFFSVFGGIIGGYDPIIPIGILISGGIVSGLASSMRYRRDFISMVLWITLTNLLIGMTIILIGGELTLPTIKLIIIFSAANALTTVSFSFLLLPLFEQFFHLTTDMTLVELADMNHPLLKRLAIEAPGTYNHSIMVANLAEAAASSIGADALLCRVVSYYHDIGKLKKPSNFIENQYSKKNIHDKISPSMSVRIITGHVREGLELAEEYRLPQAIKDIIPQHHGDAPLIFFYHKACEDKGDNDEINVRDYSYGGPKPQTRENAVVMIADSVEAASRTLKSTTVKDLRDLVKKIIWNKVSHNQLEECGLNLRDLTDMVNGMMPILEGVFHSRIEYPEEEEK